MKYLFEILYKISSKQEISFSNIDPNKILIGNMNSKQLIIIDYFKKKNKLNILRQFIIYCKREDFRKKNILILPLEVSENLCKEYEKDNLIIKKANILDGFQYIDKNKYILYDASLITRLENIKNKYMEGIKDEY